MRGLKQAAAAAAACLLAASGAKAAVAIPDAGGNISFGFYLKLSDHINVQTVKIDITLDPSIDLDFDAFNYVQAANYAPPCCYVADEDFFDNPDSITKTATGYEIIFSPEQTDIIVDTPHYPDGVSPWYYSQELQGQASGKADGPVTYNITYKQLGRSLVPTTSAPEPATWALMIGGFGLAGASLRRAKAHARPA